MQSQSYYLKLKKEKVMLTEPAHSNEADKVRISISLSSTTVEISISLSNTTVATNLIETTDRITATPITLDRINSQTTSLVDKPVLKSGVFCAILLVDQPLVIFYLVVPFSLMKIESTCQELER